MATLSVVKTLAKIGIAGGAVAVTSNHGVWSTNTENGMKSLNKAKTVFYSAADKEIIEKGNKTETKITRQVLSLLVHASW
ncbi:hypothetical protein ACF0H5_024132 [Mactra antiquata]